MKRYALLVAAGSGKRMGAPVPKQFLPVAGKPLLYHTLQRMFDFDAEMRLILVLHPDYIDTWKELVSQYDITIPHEIVEGGAERFHSVKSAIDSIFEEDAVVGIHDGVRPLVSIDTLRRCYETAERMGNAVPVVAVNDSLREVHGEQNHAIARSNIRIVQTPQCFRLKELRSAFEQSYHASFTDDASVMEAAGHTIHLVEGNRENMKVTTPEDMRFIEWVIRVEG
ncbi:MAG: 2-C-methyl-D-erythritol 4-phosphate cytidylyltransferase [Flavobacteriales bacterium]